MTYLFGDCELNPEIHELQKAGRVIAVEPRVLDLLLYLVEHRERLIGRDELNRNLWDGRIVSDWALSTCIKNARLAIGDNGRRQDCIRTVRRRGYRFVGDVTVQRSMPRGAARAAVESSVGPTMPNKPSIAVLPFDNMSADPEQAYFADGIAEDVITALSRFHSLFVIARNSSFTYKDRAVDITQIGREMGVRYVVEGSVRKTGNRVRISAQLVDATSGDHLWAESFDGHLDDIFDLQDRITEQIVVAVEPEISAKERDRAWRKPPERLDAWELMQRGLSHYYRTNHADQLEAHRLFEEATVLDPDFAAAHAYLAITFWYLLLYTKPDDLPGAIGSARMAAERSLALNPNEPVAHLALGQLNVVAGEIEMAVGEMMSAITINPNLARGHHLLGWAYHFGGGQPEQAIPHYDAALRLNPRGPQRWSSFMMKGSALGYLGHHDEAVAHCRRACQFPDGGFLTHMHLAETLAEAGQIEKAEMAVKNAMRIEPAFSIGFVRRRFLGNPHETFLNSLLDGLRKAGAPE